MHHLLSRRGFVGLIPGAAFLGLPAFSFAEQDQKVHPEFPAQNPVRVREIVGAAHGNVARVKELLAESPELAKATWDWGFGDWETAIGAASHTGGREIAKLLMEEGARPDLFTFVMLGHLDAVKAIVAAEPGIQHIPGPHGITLAAHARVAGEPAKVVYEYLLSLGDADRTATNLPLTEVEALRYVGRYSFGSGKDDALEVEKAKSGVLTIKRGTSGIRMLKRVEEHAFAPSGATHVRVRFAVASEASTSLSVHDPTPILVAKRVQTN